MFAFGQDAFYGSMAGQALNGRSSGIASTPDNGGYWLVGSTAVSSPSVTPIYYGVAGNASPQRRRSSGSRPHPSGKGYWLVAADGGVFAYGDATFDGSLGGQVLSGPIVGMAATPSGKGYLLAGPPGNRCGKSPSWEATNQPVRPGHRPGKARPPQKGDVGVVQVEPDFLFPTDGSHGPVKQVKIPYSTSSTTVSRQRAQLSSSRV